LNYQEHPIDSKFKHGMVFSGFVTAEGTSFARLALFALPVLFVLRCLAKYLNGLRVSVSFFFSSPLFSSRLLESLSFHRISTQYILHIDDILIHVVVIQSRLPSTYRVSDVVLVLFPSMVLSLERGGGILGLISGGIGGWIVSVSFLSSSGRLFLFLAFCISSKP
jgi:hypothetical protein